MSAPRTRAVEIFDDAVHGAGGGLAAPLRRGDGDRGTVRDPGYPLGTKANTRLGLPVPPTSFSGETTSSAPVSGSLSRFASWVRP